VATPGLFCFFLLVFWLLLLLGSQSSNMTSETMKRSTFKSKRYDD